MAIFTFPTSFRLANNGESSSIFVRSLFGSSQQVAALGNHDAHPPLVHLVLLVFEAVMEVVCVSLPGYIIARQGMFDADKQKFLANLNVALFTPCLIFTKLASQLTAETLKDLAVIPVIFVVQTLVSYLVSRGVSKLFGFGKRPANFVTAMGVFGNSNSLPISLVISLSQTLKGLHWDRIPGDNDEEVAARGILYLLIFQQLGQLVRWSWGYHVLLAPAEERGDPEAEDIEEGRSRENAGSEYIIPGLDGGRSWDLEHGSTHKGHLTHGGSGNQSSTSFDSGGRTPVTNAQYINSEEEEEDEEEDEDEDQAQRKALLPNPPNEDINRTEELHANLTSFPTIRSLSREEANIPSGIRGVIPSIIFHIKRPVHFVSRGVKQTSRRAFQSLPVILQRLLTRVYRGLARFLYGMWEFMNPPLWAMLFAVIVASIPRLQRLFFEEGSFIANSATRAVAQSGGVAVPLILVVLGANLARNTLPKAALEEDSEENQIGGKLLVASLISRMLLPTLIMAPILAVVAKYVPVSIVDDPIFVIVCFLLTGAPSALQLAQICQINGVYEGVMSKLLFQSYVIWILPSTLVLVMCALEVVEWANPTATKQGAGILSMILSR